MTEEGVAENIADLIEDWPGWTAISAGNCVIASVVSGCQELYRYHITVKEDTSQ